MLAVGSHDNAIDIYYVKYTSSSDSNNCNNNDSLVMKLVKRLRGHSSYITHLDWSHDNRIIRSNCGSYELLFWDIGTGKLLMSALDSHR
jgi:microtubule-associated protein-like 4